MRLWLIYSKPCEKNRIDFIKISWEWYGALLALSGWCSLAPFFPCLLSIHTSEINHNYCSIPPTFGSWVVKCRIEDAFQALFRLSSFSTWSYSNMFLFLFLFLFLLSIIASKTKAPHEIIFSSATPYTTYHKLLALLHIIFEGTSDMGSIASYPRTGFNLRKIPRRNTHLYAACHFYQMFHDQRFINHPWWYYESI